MISSPRLDSVSFAARTEKGRRDENQDAMTDFSSPFGSVYLVADGMGGVQGGAAASLMTAECFRKYLTSFSSALPVAEALQRATSATNTELRLHTRSGDPGVAGMGSTIVLAILSENENRMAGVIAHIGDSRAYLLRDGKLLRLTRDHSAVQRLVDNNQITFEEARKHPDANVITRALGPNNEVLIEISEHMFELGDTLLLCSDGLCGYVEDAVISVELARSREVGATADALIALALASGSTDNITVQVLRIAQSETKKAFPNVLPVSLSALHSREKDVPSREGTSKIAPILRYGGTAVIGLILGILGAQTPLAARLRGVHELTRNITTAPSSVVSSPATSAPCSPATVTAKETANPPATPSVGKPGDHKQPSSDLKQKGEQAKGDTGRKKSPEVKGKLQEQVPDKSVGTPKPLDTEKEKGATPSTITPPVKPAPAQVPPADKPQDTK